MKKNKPFSSLSKEQKQLIIDKLRSKSSVLAGKHRQPRKDRPIWTDKDEAKQMVEKLMGNPNLLNEFNSRMRIHKLEQLKKNKK